MYMYNYNEVLYYIFIALSLELEGFKTICHLEPPLICQTEYQVRATF